MLVQKTSTSVHLNTTGFHVLMASALAHKCIQLHYTCAVSLHSAYVYVHMFSATFEASLLAQVL